MRAIVCGAGLQGVPIAHALLELGLDVNIVEPNQDNVTAAREKLKETNPKACQNHRFLFYNDLKDVATGGVEFVISAAPYHQNVKIAKWACENGLMYFDLGGDPDTREEIHNFASENGCYTLTDLGLAPGLVNIIAEHMAYSYPMGIEEVTDIYMRVGGLPIDPTGFLNYKRTWSTHGLRNEYSGACQCIKYRNQTHANALTEIERVDDFEELGVMECFHTKGGLSHSYDDMYEHGVANCNYKTLRWPGHADALRFLIDQCQLDETTFDNAIENSCPITREDQVLLLAKANGSTFKTIIKHDHNWTAMQIATAFPAAAAAFTIATAANNGEIVEDNKNLTYRPLSTYLYPKFVENLCDIDHNAFSDVNTTLYVDNMPTE